MTSKTIGWLVHTSSSSARGAAKGVVPGDASCSARGVISTSSTGGRRGVPFGSSIGGGAAPAGQSGGTEGGGATAIGNKGAGSARGGHVAGAAGGAVEAGGQRPVAAGTTVGEGGACTTGGGDRETTRVGEAASGDGCRIVPPFDGGELVASAAAAFVQAGGTVGGAATKCGDARAARTSSRSSLLKTSGSSTHSTS